MHDEHRSGMRYGVMLLIAVIFLVAPAWAGTKASNQLQDTHSQKQAAPSELVAMCDKLAADPFDPRRRVAPLFAAKYSANLITQAVKTCTLALEQNPNDLVLQYQLGQALYRAGQKNEGANYMLSAAKKQYPQAFCTIGGIYLQATKKGDPAASQYLPVKNVEDALYLPIKNEGEAYRWVEQGAKLGASDCKVILGRKYLLDTKEYTKARSWLEEAEKQGNSSAREWLAELRKVNPTAQ
jgi:TPR repeat protein